MKYVSTLWESYLGMSQIEPGKTRNPAILSGSVNCDLQGRRSGSEIRGKYSARVKRVNCKKPESTREVFPCDF
jgi:hypothetical protein